MVNEAVARQKRQHRELTEMTGSLQGMMQVFGIPSIEFADEDGKVHGQITAQKPNDVPCHVPAKGGGTVAIKQGDRIKLWFRGKYLYYT